jgi:NAD(P)-dependent dehydrogenase (short-subunit alcohol dehydrogenase family)
MLKHRLTGQFFQGAEDCLPNSADSLVGPGLLDLPGRRQRPDQHTLDHQSSREQQFMSNHQKVAIVTGASQGIGAGLVKAFRDRNYRVIANSRSIKPSSDPDVIAVAGDIADRAVAERIVKEALSRFGRVDTLVNNAGIFTMKPFTEFTAQDYADNISVNLTGFFHITQLAIAEMEKQRSGHVVNISTGLVDHAVDGVPSVLASLTKGGLNSATKSLAIEYAKRGIRVNAVAPGVVKTPMHAPEHYDVLAGLHPVKRMGEISDVTEAVLYLDSAGFVTGEILHVDGGQSAGH